MIAVSLLDIETCSEVEANLIIVIILSIGCKILNKLPISKLDPWLVTFLVPPKLL